MFFGESSSQNQFKASLGPCARDWRFFENNQERRARRSGRAISRGGRRFIAIALEKLMKIHADLLETLEKRFENIDLLRQALTHSSWANENGQPGKHNERLEFLGDAVLELCVSAELYRRYPDAREGVLTAMRAALVGEKSLAAIGRRAGLGNCLRLGSGEEKQGGRERDSILADALEAVLGAVFLDCGFAEAGKVVAALFAGLWPDAGFAKAPVNGKSLLQEICQKKYGELPRYMPLGCFGPAHEKIFMVKALLPDGREFVANGTSQKKAERACAELALAALGVNRTP